MEPVIGVDVSKGNSMFQAFTGRNEAFGKTEVMIRDEEGFGRLKTCAGYYKNRAAKCPWLFSKRRGHYHKGLVTFLVQEGIQHCIVNPLQSKRARGTKLRKVKMDAADAWHLAEMYYRGEVHPHRISEEVYTELQHVTRQHEFVTGLYVQAKLNTRALLDQVFPGFEGVFHDLYSETSLRVLACCLRGEANQMRETIEKTAGRFMQNRGWKKRFGIWKRRCKNGTRSK